MNKNENSKKKFRYLFSGIPLKLKSLNLHKSSLKKKPSRNIFYDEKLLSKNNENVSIISDQSINIFYKNSFSKLIDNEQSEQNKKEKNSMKKQDSFNDFFLRNTNFYSLKNKKFISDSFSQGSLIKNLSNNTITKFPKLNSISTFETKKNYLSNFRNRKNIINFEYKIRLKKVNSSFSPDSCYNFEKKMAKDFSDKNILCNDSIFSSNKTINIANVKIKKLNYKKLKHNNSYIKEKINFNGKIFPYRKNYKFIVDPLPYGKTEEFKDFSENIKKIDRKAEKLLKNDNKKIFSNLYSIVDKYKFSDKYQNPFIYDYDIYRRKQNQEYKPLVNPEVYKEHLKILNELKKETNNNNERNIKFIGHNEDKMKKITSKQKLFEKLKYYIIRISQFLKRSDITREELKKFKLIKYSFTYKLTKPLIDYIKLKNYDVCCEILKKHKYLVLDFDYYYLTPLHWAVKKNFYEIIIKLLEYGSIVDSRNFSGDSPLHIAVKNNFYDSACILLYFLASPFLKDLKGKRPIEVTDDFDMKTLLERMMRIHYISVFLKTANQQRFIQNSLWIFIKEEFNKKISPFLFNFIKEKEFLAL